jgi:hypothetical protein
MSLIQPQPRIERQTVTIRLEAPTVRALKLYAEYIQSSQEWVVSEGLRLAFTKDDGFQQWLRNEHPDAANGLPSAGKSPRRPHRGRARVVDAAAAASVSKSV